MMLAVYAFAGSVLGAVIVAGLIVTAQAGGGTGQIPYFSESIVGVSVLGILLLFWKVQRSIIHPLERRVAAAERAERVCAWRLQEVVGLLASGRRVTMAVVTDDPPEYLNGEDRADEEHG